MCYLGLFIESLHLVPTSGKPRLAQLLMQCVQNLHFIQFHEVKYSSYFIRATNRIFYWFIWMNDF